MSAVTITQGTRSGKTSVSNRFIDDYMKDANDAQIKIYLYLLRAAGTSLPAGISDLADKFNHTEQDVMRALKYWDKLHIISLLYSEDKKLIGIRLEDLDAQPVNILSMPVSLPILQSSSQADAAAEAYFSTSDIVPMHTSAGNAQAPFLQTPAPAAAQEAPEDPMEKYQEAKRNITNDQLRAYKTRATEDCIILFTEQYLGKTLSSSEIRSLYFITDILHMNIELLDYLIQYCVDKGKKDFHYIEKVAINWTEEGITTAKQAAAAARKHNKQVYAILKELGLKGEPAPKEVDYIRRWTDEFGFTQEMILEACGRTVLATDKNRIKYTDGILKNWYDLGIRTLQDAQTKDVKAESSSRSKQTGHASNQFNTYQQNSYNYDQLLDQIRIN